MISNSSKKQILSFVDNMLPADQNVAKELLAKPIFASAPLSMVVGYGDWLKFLKFMRPAFKVPTRI